MFGLDGPRVSLQMRCGPRQLLVCSLVRPWIRTPAKTAQAPDSQKLRDGECRCSATTRSRAIDDRSSRAVLVVKNSPANAGDIRDTGLIPGSGRSPGGGHCHPLQHPCLDRPLDRGAWQATVHGVARQMHLKRLSTHTTDDDHTHTDRSQ